MRCGPSLWPEPKSFTAFPPASISPSLSPMPSLLLYHQEKNFYVSGQRSTVNAKWTQSPLWELVKDFYPACLGFAKINLRTAQRLFRRGPERSLIICGVDIFFFDRPAENRFIESRLTHLSKPWRTKVLDHGHTQGTPWSATRKHTPLGERPTTHQEASVPLCATESQLFSDPVGERRKSWTLA